MSLLQKEKYHTHLAVLYADRVLGLISRPSATDDQLSAARQKLQRLLKESNLYRVQLLLGRYPIHAPLLQLIYIRFFYFNVRHTDPLFAV